MNLIDIGIKQGIKQGISEGELKKLILQVSRKKAKNCSVSEAAEMLETEESIVQKVYDVLETKNAETQWQEIIPLLKSVSKN